MRFKNSIRLIFENFSSIYKVLLFRIIVMTVLGSLVAALIMPNITMIIKSQQLDAIFKLVKDFLKSILNGTISEAYGEKFKDVFSDFYVFVQIKAGRIIVSGVILLVLYIVGRFLNGLSNYVMGIMVNDHMSSLTKRSFVQSLIRDLKNACVYQIVIVCITAVYDALLILICFNIMFGLFNALGFLSVLLSSTVFVSLMALRLTYLSDIMPAIITDKLSLKQAFAVSFKMNKKHQERTYSTYLVSILFIIYLNVSMAIFTFMASLIITVPLSLLLLVCIQFVSYYSATDKKYFINYDNIIIPKNLREEEKYLESMDI